jgi:hypothetical protein
VACGQKEEGDVACGPKKGWVGGGEAVRVFFAPAPTPPEAGLAQKWKPRQNHREVGKQNHREVGKQKHRGVGKQNHREVGEQNHREVGKQNHREIRKTKSPRNWENKTTEKLGKKNHLEVGKQNHQEVGKQNHRGV